MASSHRQRLNSEDVFEEPSSKPNIKVLEARKEKSRDAARSRRSRENAQYLELAKLLPLPSSVTSQLDKASVIKLTMSFLKMRNFSDGAQLKNGDTVKQESTPNGAAINMKDLFENEFGLNTLQALDGFLFAISSEGKFLYVSETISTYLGLSQVELVGSNVCNYIHPDDHKEVSDLLLRIPTETDDGYDDDEEMMETVQSHDTKIEKDDVITTYLRMKCTLVKRSGCYNKSSGYKTIHIVGRMVPSKELTADNQKSYALIAVGQPLAPPAAINELLPESHVFISRVGMDLKVVFCEGRINSFMDYKAKDIVGISAYDFYHSADMGLVQKSHKKCVKKGEVVTQCYRWMNKSGGWVWMQTMARQVVKSTPHGDEPQILCVNYLISDVEHRGVVMHDIQQYFAALPEDNSPDSFDDYEMKPRKLLPPPNTFVEEPQQPSHDLIDNSLTAQLWKEGSNNNNSMVDMMMSEPSPGGQCSTFGSDEVFNESCIDDYITETMEEDVTASLLTDIVQEVNSLDAVLPKTDVDNDDAVNWSGIDMMLFDDLCRKTNNYESCQYANSSPSITPHYTTSSPSGTPFSPAVSVKTEAMSYSPAHTIPGQWHQERSESCSSYNSKMDQPILSPPQNGYANQSPGLSTQPVQSIPQTMSYNDNMVHQMPLSSNAQMPYSQEQYQILQQRQQIQMQQQKQYQQPPPDYNSLIWQQQQQQSHQNGTQNMTALNQKMSRLAHPLSHHSNFNQPNMYNSIQQYY